MAEDRFGEAAIRAREQTVGITEYIHGPSFKGMLKERWEDFEVREIGLDGQVADDSTVIIKTSNLDQESAKLQLKSVLGDAEADRVLVGLERKENFLIGPFAEKEMRTTVHRSIKAFPGWITESGEGGTIKVMRKSSSDAAEDARNRPGNQKVTWLKFCLHKSNMDTMDACSWLAARLKLTARDFSYAGTKDRRAKTWQWVTVKGIKAERLASINEQIPAKRSADDVDETVPSKQVSVSQIESVKAPLRLADLKGNRFTLVIRQVLGMEHVSEAMQRLSEHGFINYFGLQRFGTTSVSSHAIGLTILKRLWKEACEMILDPRPEDSDEIRQARAMWREDPEGAWKALPGRMQAERSVLRHLTSHSDDYQGAIMAINREMRTMYLHAVQSWLWNLMASHRISKLGMSVMVGEDLVGSDGELASSEHSIFDIVLPLPGHAVTIPPWALKLLAEHSVDPAIFAPCDGWHLPGAYRTLMGRVEGLEHSQVDENTVKVSFSLSTSCYATMALREIMK